MVLKHYDNIHRSTAVNNTYDGRRTICMATVSSTADGCQTLNIV